MPVQNVTAQDVKQWLDQGEAIIVDVREPAEHKSQFIPSAINVPLGKIAPEDVTKHPQKVVIHCQKGQRGQSACEKLLSINGQLEVYHLDGGIEAWAQQSMPVQTGTKKILPLDRQVQLTIGLGVLIASLLGYFYNPNIIFVSAFFGAGLTFAGLSGFCGLARVMAKMPWNHA